MLFLNRKVLLICFLVTYFCFADKTYFSRWITIDSENPKKIYIFETILGKGLNYCIQSCKAKRMCEYINFKVNAKMCSLIGVEKDITDSANNTHDDKIEKRKGYILGRKQDWDMEEYEVCKSCRHSGECQMEAGVKDIFDKCQNSGCGPPEDKMFSTVHGNMFSIGDRAMYQCKTGNKNAFNKTAIVTCQSSGIWSNIDFKCVKDDSVCDGNTCYFVNQEKRSWNDSTSYCDSIGGFLADIKTNDEYSFIQQNVPKITQMWLGGNDINIEGKWIWLDGTEVGELNVSLWKEGQPGSGRGENCLAFWDDERWHDVGCLLLLKSLCKINI